MGVSTSNDNIIVLPVRHDGGGPSRLGTGKPSRAQRDWLMRGLGQAGGKLPLFDSNGRHVNDRTVRACIRNGWAKPWFENPLKPNWLVCKLTHEGRQALQDLE